MASNITAAPIVVAPSQHWEGNDGPWSTFDINVGTPPQPVRVLVSTALGETWVVSANKTQGGCLESDASSCAQSRGALFSTNASSTWEDQGIFDVGLELNLPDYLGDQNANYGLETLRLGLPGSDVASEPNMVIGALATKKYYHGFFGVTKNPTNFTEFNDPQPSFLSRLSEQNKIPSRSFAYSAGAYYRFKKVQGSLTLGGYDASKFIPNAVDFQFADDISRDLVVGLQSITFSDPKTPSKILLSEGILTFIDSTVPHIWLPLDACKRFEAAFGLTYNSTVERYLVNNTLHEQLQSRNPSITFSLGDSISGGSKIDITFPYAAFDLSVDYPIVDTKQYYFPLRRADNETQYTLGRTFLQESYLIVNYEHNNFSVSQNVWNEDARSQILAIRSANSTTPPPPKPAAKSGVSTGAIVGIIVAIVALILAAAGATFFIIRRHRKRRKEMETKTPEDDGFRKPEMDGNGKVIPGELYTEGKLGEVDSSSRVEMQGSQPGFDVHDKNRAEVEGTRGGVEMEGTKAGVEMEGNKLRTEMAGDHLAPVELDAGSHGLSEMLSPIPSNSDFPSPSSSGTEKKRGPAITPGRRHKLTSRLADSESSDLSPDAETPGRRSQAGSWIRRRTDRRRQGFTPDQVSSPSSDSRGRRPSGSSPNTISSPSSSSHEGRPNIPFQRNTSLGVNLHRNSPMDISSQSSSSRERQRDRGNALDRRIERGSDQTTASDIPSLSDNTRSRSDSAEQWSQIFGSRERILTPRSSGNLSPGDPNDRRPSNGSREMVDRRRPSPLGTSLRNTTSRNTPPAERNRGLDKPLPPGNFF